MNIITFCRTKYCTNAYCKLGPVVDEGITVMFGTTTTNTHADRIVIDGKAKEKLHRTAI